MHVGGDGGREVGSDLGEGRDGEGHVGDGGGATDLKGIHNIIVFLTQSHPYSSSLIHILSLPLPLPLSLTWLMPDRYTWWRYSVHREAGRKRKAWGNSPAHHRMWMLAKRSVLTVSNIRYHTQNNGKNLSLDREKSVMVVTMHTLTLRAYTYRYTYWRSLSHW